MKEIKILEEELINKIAAGEVVERPASVVKELVENSIDAGAKKIVVETVEGGKSKIRVKDDGHGMDEANAKISFERHSTSKIDCSDDLFNIQSLGFRGEALASIAAVSRMQIITKTKDTIEGISIWIEAGELKRSTPIAANVGTEIIVEDLFFNTPARKKYLKPITAELSHITDIITRYALANPEIDFKFTNNGKEILHSPSTTNTLSNISHIYGRAVARDLLPINHSSGAIEIMGYIGRPSVARSAKDMQTFLVNKRFIKSKLLSGALNDAYHTMMMVNRFPVAILDISLDPKQIDVNVHPAKERIRIGKEKDVYEAVFDAVRQTLIANDLIPDSLQGEMDTSLFTYDTNITYTKEVSRQKTLKEGTKDVMLDRIPSMMIHGLINKTYIIAETAKELLLIDQHAAAERILYEKFLAMKKDLKVQELIEPMMIELTPKQSLTVKDNQDVFEKLGIGIEEFGTNTFLIRTVPIIFKRVIDKDFIKDMIVEFVMFDKIKKLEELKEERIAKMACRKAIKAGYDAGIAEIKEYMRKLDAVGVPFTCPHGRPVIIRFSFKELEKMFKRRV